MTDDPEVLGLLRDGVIAAVTYRTNQGTEKTIRGEVEDLSPRNAGKYDFNLTVGEDDEEKRRRVIVGDRSASVKARDRSVDNNWRKIGSADLEDVSFDLRLGGWRQRADAELRWVNPDPDTSKSEMYLTRPLHDTRSIKIVADEEVLDGEPMTDLGEAIDVAESLMEFQY